MARKPATPGSRLVAQIKKDVPEGVELDERDHAVLALIEATADDIARLESACADVLIRDVAGTQKLNAAYTEVRLARAQLHRMIASLKLTPAELPVPKSARHVQAANARWHRGGVA
jgi:hypothetical protein